MTVNLDCRGLPLQTANAAAAAAFERGVRGYATWRRDAIQHLDAATAADPGFALPLITKGWILQMARSAAYHGKIQALLNEAAPLLRDARERALHAGLAHALAGRGVEAASILEAWLAGAPTDLLAHRLVQFELFWNGRAHWMRDIAERAAPAWHDATPDLACFLAVRAFSSEEAGDYGLAETCGRRSVELDPTDCWGAHAIAHVLVMQGRVEEGAAWLEGLSHHWAEANQMGHHLWWHLCLFLFERGEHARILDLLATQVRNPESPLVKAMPDATIDLQNVASLLLRLELRGVDVGARWETIADICAGRVADMANPFASAHDVMVLAATGRFERCRELIANMRAVAEGGGTLALAHRAAGIATAEAMLAHRLGEHARVIDLLTPVRHDLPLIGGSHAQRDVFYQVMVDSARRVGRADLVPLYLADVRRMGFDRVPRRTLYRTAA